MTAHVGLQRPTAPYPQYAGDHVDGYQWGTEGRGRPQVRKARTAPPPLPAHDRRHRQDGFAGGENPCWKPAAWGRGFWGRALRLAAAASHPAVKRRLAVVMWTLGLMMLGAGVFNRIDTALHSQQSVIIGYRNL